MVPAAAPKRLGLLQRPVADPADRPPRRGRARRRDRRPRSPVTSRCARSIPRTSTDLTRSCCPRTALRHGRSSNEMPAPPRLALAAVPFDLTRDLPVRATLFSRNAGRAPAPADHPPHRGGRRVPPPLANDLSTAYAARHGGTEPVFEPLPVQYADFVVWQRETLAGRARPAGRLLGRAAGRVAAGGHVPVRPAAARPWRRTRARTSSSRSPPSCTAGFGSWPDRPAAPRSWCCRRQPRRC